MAPFSSIWLGQARKAPTPATALETALFPFTPGEKNAGPISLGETSCVSCLCGIGPGTGAEKPLGGRFLGYGCDDP